MPNGKLLTIGSIRTVGLVGVGSVGSGWATLLLANGFQVVATDPSIPTLEALPETIEQKWKALEKLGLAPVDRPPLDNLNLVSSIEKVASESDLIQENAPEPPDIKGEIISQIDAYLPPDRLILSSSGGVPPSRLQQDCAHPERLLLGHPFHPAHIVPLVEVVGGEHTTPEAVNLAVEFYQRIGKHPIKLRRELVGHMTNRLQFALLREAAYCLAEGVASAPDIDAAVRYGLGPRWTLMGALMTFNLAGGDQGISAVLDRFGEDIQRWWDSLESTQLTPEVKQALIAGENALQNGHTNAEFEAWRDEALIDYFRFVADRTELPGSVAEPSN